MSGLACRIMEYAEKSPEAMPLCPATLPCLGNPDEVGQQLQYLAQSGSLMRICQGGYMRPVRRTLVSVRHRSARRSRLSRRSGARPLCRVAAPLQTTCA